MKASASDIIALISSVANVGLLIGINFKLGGVVQAITDLTRRLQRLEDREC